MRNANWKWPLTGPFLCVQSAATTPACAPESAKSALPPTADEQQTSIYVGLGPIADMCADFIPTPALPAA